MHKSEILQRIETKTNDFVQGLAVASNKFEIILKSWNIWQQTQKEL
jgi:hypothetical protein